MLQPSTELQLPYLRTYATVVASALGTAIPTLSVTAAALGGFYAQPIMVPLDYDRSRPGRLYCTIANGAGVGPAAGNVVLEGVLTHAPLAGFPTNNTVAQSHAVAAAWPANSWEEVELGSEAAPFIPGGTLGLRSVLGIRLARAGPAVGDTWAATLLLAQSLRLEYSRLCQHCCCC